MSLNNNKMLPDRIRNMRQMNDLLDAEDTILAEIEKVIDGMYARASLLHEEVINERWLEKRLEERTGADTEVTACAENLLVEILLDVSSLYDISLPDVRGFLDKWLPAHLMYKLTFLLGCTIKNRETFLLQKMVTSTTMKFWECRIWDGTWLLDGSMLLDGIRTSMGCHMCMGYKTGIQETFGTQVTTRNLWYFDGTHQLNGVKKFAGTWEEEL